jgi:hypothetical protein
MLTFRLTCLAGTSGADLQADIFWGTASVTGMKEIFSSWFYGVGIHRHVKQL